MKYGIMSFLLFVATGCAAPSNVVPPPEVFEMNFDQTDKIFVEVHNNPDYCIVRVWNPEKNDKSPLAIFRGIPGRDTCRVYNVTNPDIAPEDSGEKNER